MKMTAAGCSVISSLEPFCFSKPVIGTMADTVVFSTDGTTMNDASAEGAGLYPMPLLAYPFSPYTPLACYATSESDLLTRNTVPA